MHCLSICLSIYQSQQTQAELLSSDKGTPVKFVGAVWFCVWSLHLHLHLGTWTPLRVFTVERWQDIELLANGLEIDFRVVVFLRQVQVFQHVLEPLLNGVRCQHRLHPTLHVVWLRQLVAIYELVVRQLTCQHLPERERERERERGISIGVSTSIVNAHMQMQCTDG